MNVLFYGGRDFNNYTRLCEAMKMLPFQISYGIQGGATGADRLGKRWCMENGIHCAEVCALWDFYGKSAGYKRNFAMSEIIRIDYAIEMPGGRGTLSMRQILEKKGVVIWKPFDT
jgi:hypothetical protein